MLFVSLEDGPVSAFAGTLTGMVSVSGWVSVTNPLDATPGTLLEADADYRTRQTEQLAASGASTIASMTADLLALPNISAVRMYENTGKDPDPVTGLPPKSFIAVIYDPRGEPDENIASVLWASKPAGAQTYGSTSVVVADARGVDHTVYFQRPTTQNVWLSFSVKLAQGARASAPSRRS